MIKVLITGHSVGNDLDLCQSRGFDYEWLFRYPATLLWADKIFLTKCTWEMIIGKNVSLTKPFDKCAKLVFELLFERGLIEIFDPTKYIDADTKKNIVKAVENDIQTLKQTQPQIVNEGNIENVPNEFFIGKYHYCSPYLYSIYTSLILAKVMNAQCLFNNRALTYCNLRFGKASTEIQQYSNQIECFQTVINGSFPNEPLLPEYALFANKTNGDQTCGNCRNRSSCSDSYLIVTEKQTKKLIKLRDKEEIDSSRVLMLKIISKCKAEDATPQIIANEFYSQCQKLSKRNRKVFREIKHWCNVSMLLSIPMTSYGLICARPSILAAGTATLTLSTAMRNFMDSMQEKYRWTALINSSCSDDTKFYIAPPQRLP